jgi:hypothetical protein
MSDEISPDIAALYRASATEAPDAGLDPAILLVARRRWRPHIVFAMAAVLLFGRDDDRITPAEAPARTHPDR